MINPGCVPPGWRWRKKSWRGLKKKSCAWLATVGDVGALGWLSQNKYNMPQKKAADAKKKPADANSKGGKKNRRGCRIQIVGRSMKKKWAKLVNDERTKEGMEELPEKAFFDYSMTRACNMLKVNPADFKDALNLFKKKHKKNEDAFINLLKQGNLHHVTTNNRDKCRLVSDLCSKCAQTNAKVPVVVAPMSSAPVAG